MFKIVWGIIGIVSAIWIAGWNMFVMGLVDGISTIQSGINPMVLAIAIVKVVFATAVGWLIVILCFLFGDILDSYFSQKRS